jgi:UPF0176 protein
MLLHNRMGRPQLMARINAEKFRRITLSFYRYVNITDPQRFRDELYLALDSLGCFGRIYVASEGINAQMSVPEHNADALLSCLDAIPQLAAMHIKRAVEDDGRSFLKLIVRVRPKIVADGLTDNVFDVTNVGNHLSPLEFHNLAAREDVIVVDMRNRYESEVGRFENAYCPDAQTFREEVEMVVNQLEHQKDKKILLYCTGGVRCEKASAWMRHHGFNDVNQLHGGVIAYAAEVRKHNLNSRFIGKNFVFDERLGERITHHIIGTCHTCGESCDTHINCEWDPCHKLFIQCGSCRERLNNCCSNECHSLMMTVEAETKQKETTEVSTF